MPGAPARELTRPPGEAHPARTSPPAARGSAGSPAQARLLELQRRAGNRAVQRLLDGEGPAGPAAPAAGAAGAAAAPGRAMSRTDFESTMTARFGISLVRTGTLDSQVGHLNHLGGPVTPGQPRAGDLLRQLVDAGTLTWSSWDPGATSELYAGIVAGFEDFARTMGGIPPVREIVFYRTGYEASASPPGLVARADEGAHYSGGMLTVHASTASPNRLPIERDEPGAPAHRPDPGVVSSVASYTAHELGHGLVEAALTPPAADPGLLRDYQREVGWIRGRLYDVGDPAVRQAADSGGPAPEGARAITRGNWDSGWVEQPISAYMTTSPAEDFPEAVMAFVRMPAMLLSRSPRRHAFLDARRGALGAQLRAVATPAQP